MPENNAYNSSVWIADYARCAITPFVETSHFLDFDQQAEQLVGFGQEYHQLSPGAFEGRFLSVDFGGGVSVHVEYASQTLAQSMGAPTEYASLGFVLGDGKYVANGQLLDRNSVLLVPPGSELHFRSPLGGSIIAFCFSKDLLTHDAGSDMFSCLAAGQPAAVIEAPDFSARARRDIFDTLNAVSGQNEATVFGRILATSLLANLGAELALRSGLSTRVARNRKLENFLEAAAIFRTHSQILLGYDDLKQLTGISRRNLQNSFKEVVGCGPLEYFRLRRLCDARTRIASLTAGEQTIGDVAAESGFCDWSHFSRIYKHQFGESPSQTRQRALNDRVPS